MLVARTATQAMGLGVGIKVDRLDVESDPLFSANWSQSTEKLHPTFGRLCSYEQIWP